MPGHRARLHVRLGHRQDRPDRPRAEDAALLVRRVRDLVPDHDGAPRRHRLPLLKGVGIWGVNVPVGWGFAIINFVWWIGIGHAGTLISAILLLLRQEWRTSINRFAEAMTLFAVACAGLFPLLHLGRPWLAYWLLPYPNTMGALAAVAQPARVGRVRRFDVRDGLRALLVRRPDPGPRDAARPRAEEGLPDRLRDAGARLARLGAALAPVRDRVPAARRGSRRRSSSRCTPSSASTSRSGSSPAGTRRSSRPTSSRARSTPGSRWC